MFSRSRPFIALLLTAFYVGQFLFLGATHHHHATSACNHRSHDHGDHQHAHHCSEHSHDAAGDQAHASKNASSVHVEGNPEVDCAICRHLALPLIVISFESEVRSSAVHEFTPTVQSTFVEVARYSWPQPRSPPAFA